MDKRIRVLMFGPSLNVTGGMTAVVNNWIDVGIEDLVELKYISTIDYNESGNYFKKLANAVRSYVKYVTTKTKDYDLIHIHLAYDMSFYRKLIIVIIGCLKKDLIFVHLHGSEFERFYTNSGWFQKKLISWMFNHTSALLVLSKKWKLFVETICDNSNINILYNGADPEHFMPYLPKSNNSINILFMGVLGRRKGSYDLIEAFIPIYNKFPNVNLILGGDGEIDKTHSIIIDKGIDDRVKLMGWLSGQNKIDAFRNADIYVLPSYNEGLPVSILEAMAAGLPIISTPVGGIAEAVIEGVNGYLVNPGDIKSISRNLAHLCEDDSLRKIMGEESIRLINEKFHLRNSIEELHVLYGNALRCRACF